MLWHRGAGYVRKKRENAFCTATFFIIVGSEADRGEKGKGLGLVPVWNGRLRMSLTVLYVLIFYLSLYTVHYLPHGSAVKVSTRLHQALDEREIWSMHLCE